MTRRLRCASRSTDALSPWIRTKLPSTACGLEKIVTGRLPTGPIYVTLDGKRRSIQRPRNDPAWLTVRIARWDAALPPSIRCGAAAATGRPDRRGLPRKRRRFVGHGSSHLKSSGETRWQPETQMIFSLSPTLSLGRRPIRRVHQGHVATLAVASVGPRLVKEPSLSDTSVLSPVPERVIVETAQVRLGHDAVPRMGRLAHRARRTRRLGQVDVPPRQPTWSCGCPAHPNAPWRSRRSIGGYRRSLPVCHFQSPHPFAKIAPTPDYQHPWSIYRWLDGRTALPTRGRPACVRVRSCGVPRPPCRRWMRSDRPQPGLHNMVPRRTPSVRTTTTRASP